MARRPTVKAEPHRYRALVAGVVVAEADVWPGQSHGPAWGAMNEAYDRARR